MNITVYTIHLIRHDLEIFIWLIRSEVRKEHVFLWNNSSCIIRPHLSRVYLR